MKTRISVLIIALFAVILNLAAQDKPAKLSKEEKKAQKEKEVEALISSGEYMFVGRYANPTGMKQVSLATNPNYLKVQPELIDSQMPFYGTGYSTTGYGSDAGMKFKGKPESFTSEKGKKSWQIEASVSDQSDIYKIYLEVFPSGSAQLSITSNRRSTISYSGDIFPIQK
jgi:hypothetical protein